MYLLPATALFLIFLFLYLDQKWKKEEKIRQELRKEIKKLIIKSKL
jgi:hypothetical protein